MGIKARFTKADVQKYIQKRIANLDAVIIQRLRYIGEKFIVNARNNADFTDRTDNLRSSIGYVIMRNGIQLHANFKGKKREGVDKAIEVMNEIVSESRRGYVLIVVAGMNYAAAVESKGFDVLTGSSAQAEQDLRNAMKSISKKLRK